MEWKSLKRYLVIIPLVSGLMTPFYAPGVTLAYYPFASKKLEVAVTGSAGEVYDSSITLAKNGKKADLITELVGGLKATYTGKRHLLDVLVEDKQEIYAKHYRYTNNSQNARLNYQYERTQYDRFGFTASMDHYYNPQDFEDAFGRTGGQYSSLTRQADGSYSRDFSQRFSLTATVGGGVDIIEKEAGTDSYNLRAGLSGYYKLSNKWGLLGGYDFAFREIDDGPHSTIHALTGGTRYYFTERLFFDGIAGFQIVENFSHDILIFIHASPLIPHKDSETLSAFVDGTVLIVTEGKTRRAVAKAGIQPLRERKTNILGAILNDRSFAIPKFLYERV